MAPKEAILKCHKVLLEVDPRASIKINLKLIFQQFKLILFFNTTLRQVNL